MAELISFHPKAKKDALENVQNFVELCRTRVLAFGSQIDFDSNVWDVTESLELKGHGNKRHRLYFSTLESVDDKTYIPMREPFISFAKGYIRYMQALRPTKIISFRLSMLRIIESVLFESGDDTDPTKIDVFVLNRSAQVIAEKYLGGTAYRIAGQLEVLAKFIDEHNFTHYSFQWRNPIERPIDTVRVGNEFDQRRQEKMPSDAALDALPKIFRIAIETPDVLISSVAAILCSAPDRINEVLLLPENCEVDQNYAKLSEPAYGLRWWPAKDAEPMVKWIAPSMTSVVREAISKIRNVTRSARAIAKWYEENPSSIYLTEENQNLRMKEFLTSNEVSLIIGLSGAGSANAWCNSYGVFRDEFSIECKYRFTDVEAAMLKMLPQGFPILEASTGLQYSDV